MPFKLTDAWDMDSKVNISADADTVYQYISNVSNVSQWSDECVKSEKSEDLYRNQYPIFYGQNTDGASTWTTACVVTKNAFPHYEFSVIRFKSGEMCRTSKWETEIEIGDQIWGFEVVEKPNKSSELHHYMKMTKVNSFFADILESSSDPQLALESRKNQVGEMLAKSLLAIKANLEAE